MAGKPTDADVLSLDSEFSGTPEYAQEFLNFIDEACTIYHTAAFFKRRIGNEGFVELREDQDWTQLLHPGGRYFVSRGSSALIAFSLGSNFEAGDPFAMIGSHIDALCMKVKPHSKVSGKEEWERLGVAPYSVGGASVSWDASFSTWWDRDLGCGGRVLVKGENGKIEQKLIKMPGAIARIPTLATHFGAPAKGPFNYETQMVPIIGLNPDGASSGHVNTIMGKHHSARFLRAIASASGAGIKAEDILDFSLELFDSHPSTLLGLKSEFISAPRMDDRLCSFAAIEALLTSIENEEIAAFNKASRDAASASKGKKAKAPKETKDEVNNGRYAKLVALFDNEEVGSVLRVGAKSNFLRSVIERVVEAFVVKAAQQKDVPLTSSISSSFLKSATNNSIGGGAASTIGIIGQALAKSFLISADVSHAINPNFDGIYLEGGGSPGLNKGPAIYMDANGHMTSEPIGSTMMRILNEKIGGEGEVQLLYPRNDSRTGGTIGPTLSQDLGVKAIDMGIPMMSMHSIRAITGSKDVAIAVRLWSGFFDLFGELDLGGSL